MHMTNLKLEQIVKHNKKHQIIHIGHIIKSTYFELS